MSIRNISLHPSLKGKLPDIIDITDTLPRAKRWEELEKPYRHKGHWDGKTLHTGFRKAEDIDTIMIHHSGPPEAPLTTHARNHGKKWGAGICYHIGIDEGRIKQLNDLLSFTYHAGNHNTYTVSIMVNRDLSKSDLTSIERELLYGAIISVKAVLPIKHILGHNEVGATACPCTSMNRIRTDIEAMENRMAFEQSTARRREMAHQIANQALYLYNMMNGKLPDGKPSTDGQKVWAENMLVEFYPFLKEKGLVK